MGLRVRPRHIDEVSVGDVQSEGPSLSTRPQVFNRSHDARVRAAAFEWLVAQVAVHGDVIPRTVLAKGYEFQGKRVPLLGPQGIFKPAIMEVPLSIATAPNGPYYDDAFGPDGLLRYRYRGRIRCIGTTGD